MAKQETKPEVKPEAPKVQENPPLHEINKKMAEGILKREKEAKK